MATSSILKLGMDRMLETAERLAGTKLPREVVEVTLEPSLNTICIRFKKPTAGELGEAAHPQIHLFRNRSTDEVTAVELLDINEIPKERS